MIPKVIHYCWFGGKPLPRDVEKCIKSWKTFCPDYEIKRWDESNFDIAQHPFCKAAYEAKVWAFVSDYARLKAVYDEGGIYLDTDVELLRSPDFLLEYEGFLATDQIAGNVATGLGFGAEKGNRVIEKMLGIYDEVTFDPENRAPISCPVLNTRVLKELGYEFSREIRTVEGVAILPPCYCDPISPGDTEDLLCDKTLSIHHYSASWTSASNLFKRKLIRLIGQKRINALKKLLRRR